MKTEKIIDLWKACSGFVNFLNDFPGWLESEVKPGDDARAQLLLEYDKLFKYTDADIRIWLWASVCKYPEGTLYDGTTLDVIRMYRAWGYREADMDGNPPDFLGQLFRFQCYLYAAALHALKAGEPAKAGELLEAAQGCLSEYLQDTAASVAADLRRYSCTKLFLDFADAMADFLEMAAEEEAEAGADGPAENRAAGGMPSGTGTDAEAYAASLAAAVEAAGEGDKLRCFGAYLFGRGPEIPVEEPHVVFSGGRNNCGGKCSMHVTVQEGCVTGLTAGCTIAQPGMRACVRGRGYRRTFLSPDRLRYPMKRIGKRGEGKFARISWEEAADYIASEWIRIRDRYGAGARYVNYGDGVCGMMRPDELVKRLLNLDGGQLTRYGSYSSACARFATPLVYGDNRSGNSVEDILNTKLLLLWGHNPSETIFSPETDYYIAKARSRGTRVIVIDPRRSDTAIGLSDEWIPIRPGTDAALAAAMAFVIWSEGLQDQRFMDRYCIGFDEAHLPEGVPASECFRAYLSGEADGIAKTPEWAEDITGIPADVIRRIAVEYASAKPACLLPGLGCQRVGNGEQNVRMLCALACMTGNVGIPGGSAAGHGEVTEETKPEYPTGDNAYPGKISMFSWAEAICRGHEMTAQKDGVQGMDKLDADIKMLFSLASNTLINQHSDINQTIRILQDENLPECIVASDIFMTPSARFADILLPGISFFEEMNLSEPWRSGHYLIGNNPSIAPVFGSRDEYFWVGDVAKRLGLWEQWSLGRKTPEEWLRAQYEECRAEQMESLGAENALPPFDEFMAAGGFTYPNAKNSIAYEAQIRDPEHHPFKTPSGKIEIFSSRLYEMHRPDDIPAVPKYVPCPEGPEDPLREKYPLQLIGWHTKRRCHTVHDNNPWMEEVEPQRLWIHPEDASPRGILDGDTVDIYNDRGRIRMAAAVTDRVIPGVIAMPQGAWYTPDENGIDRRGCINVLTAYRPTPLAFGNPQHTNLAEVEKAKQPANHQNSVNTIN